MFTIWEHDGKLHMNLTVVLIRKNGFIEDNITASTRDFLFLFCFLFLCNIIELYPRFHMGSNKNELFGLLSNLSLDVIVMGIT